MKDVLEYLKTRGAQRIADLEALIREAGLENASAEEIIEFLEEELQSGAIAEWPASTRGRLKKALLFWRIDHGVLTVKTMIAREKARPKFKVHVSTLDKLFGWVKPGVIIPGIPAGHVIAVYGPPAVGKTLFGYHALLGVLLPKEHGGLGPDAESILFVSEPARNLAAVENIAEHLADKTGVEVDLDRVKIFPLEGETLSRANMILDNLPLRNPGVLVIDSLSSLLNMEFPDFDRSKLPDRARVLKQHNKVLTRVTKRNVAVIEVFHAQVKPATEAEVDVLSELALTPYDMPGGFTIKHSVTWRVNMTHLRGLDRHINVAVVIDGPAPSGLTAPFKVVAEGYLTDPDAKDMKKIRDIIGGRGQIHVLEP